jgi:hypothetical protein
MAAHNIEPAYTPTYSSWLNAIEAHFTSLKKFAIGGTDDPSHEYRRWRIARYLTWRNKEKGSSKAALAQFSRVKLYRHWLVPSSSTDQLLVSTMVIRRAERAAGCRPS